MGPDVGALTIAAERQDHVQTDAEMAIETARADTRDLQFAVDGSMNEIEEEVSFDSLSAPVQQALKVKAGVAKITKIESLTKHEMLVAYEAAIMKGTKKGEVQVGPNGETSKYAE